jgi:hypothetical protein
MALGPDTERHPRTKLLIRLTELTAVRNPELIGSAEWTFRVWVNGLERWQTEERVTVREGQTVYLGAEIPVAVFDESQEVGIDIEGIEKDWLNPDDKATGGVVLHRGQGFSAIPGEMVELTGSGALLQLSMQIEVNPAGWPEGSE